MRLQPPKLLVDAAWERAVLGPFVDEARRALKAQLATGEAVVDVVPTLERAYRGVPFYQRRFAQCALGLADLEDPRALAVLPVTRRSDVAERFTDFLVHPLEPFALERGWLGRTSGSTGAPISYLRDPRTHAWFWAFVDFALAYVGLPESDRPIVLLDSLAHLPQYEAELPLFHGARFYKRSSDVAVDELPRLRPQVITGDPESLAVLARCDLGRVLVLSSAFAMPRATREAIEATGAVVLEYYATQETSVIGVQCRAGQGFHPLSGACHVESVDGELVVTATHNPSFPLIRYAPGDCGAVVDAPCSCGLRGRRIVSLDGRTDVRFVGANGEFLAATVGPLLARLPIVEHQLVQHAVDRYTLRVRGLSPVDTRVLVARLSELAGVPVRVELVRLDRIARTGSKPQPFVVEP